MKPKNRPKYWRSLAELEGDPEFQEYVQREFRSPTEQKELSSEGRRRFVQLMGASFALSGCNWRQEKILPYARRPDAIIPGNPVYYATTMDLAGAATGLLVHSFDGRPIKVEGNPADPGSQGGTGTYHQGSVLSLYDPDRSSKVLHGGKPTDWHTFEASLAATWDTARQNGGRGFFVLSRASSSPTLARLRKKLLDEAPEAKWVAYEPTHAAGPLRGSALAFGRPVATRLDPEKADVIVALDSDFISSAVPDGLANARAVSRRRDPHAGEMSRLYAFEPSVSDFGSLCDHRIAVKPSQILSLALYLDAAITEARHAPGGQAAPGAAALGGEEVKKVLEVAAKDLVAHAGRCLVTAGSQQAPEVHALVHRINEVLGNVGKTVKYAELEDAIYGGADELAELVAEIEGGRANALLILGGNPVYEAPQDIAFSAALAKVQHTFHLGLHVDETGQLCEYHAPLTHFLEAWGDARGLDGMVRLAQPLIHPLLGGRSELEVIGAMLGETHREGMELVRATHKPKDEKAWRMAVHDGFFGQPTKTIRPELLPLSPIDQPEPAGGLEVVFAPDPALFDGRYANNGWLQELPHPLSKLTWGNAALVSPATAIELGIQDGHLCRVSLDGQSVEMPSLVSPGQADGVVHLSLGYGRTAAGVVGGAEKEGLQPVGANTYLLRSSKSPHFAVGAKIQATGPRQQLALTQDLWAIDEIGKYGQEQREDALVRETTLETYEEHPEVIKHKVHHPPLLNLWRGPVSYEGHKWGMAVDLNKCTGCSACIVACQSENNIAVVGPKEVAKGRELNWIRVERYYKGDPTEAAVRQQPVMCMHCENAPCEQVCPVGATMHSTEGLNDMVYNRCIGTRYCSNNCPYKVRRFNYRNYNLDVIGSTPYTGTDDPRAKLKSMVFNPEVTVRSRGVMEKCTFCVQRIQNVKIKAKNEKRPIADGEIKTACQQACPTEAILFGDLNDKSSQVLQKHRQPRAYELLVELNNRPRVNYLARIQNPHPELKTQDGDSKGHH